VPLVSAASFGVVFPSRQEITHQLSHEARRVVNERGRIVIGEPGGSPPVAGALQRDGCCSRAMTYRAVKDNFAARPAETKREKDEVPI
jgi:hypothetical protein